MNTDTPTLRHSDTSSAFTLIELLLSMAILTAIILMVSNMFQDVSEAWNIGTKKAEINTAGRAAVEYMARELSQAVAGPVESAGGTPFKVKFRLFSNGQDVRFVALSGDPADGRALRGVLFRYDSVNKILEAHRETASFDPYSQEPAWGGGSAQMLIENVLDFRVCAYATEADLNPSAPNPDWTYDSAANSDRLPVCVDICLVLLSGDDMAKAESLGWDANFMNRNAKCYTTRVYFPNRDGYLQR